MRILVTGATGYVGSRLVTALADAHSVVAAARNPRRLRRFGWYDDVTPVPLDAAEPAATSAGLEDAIAASLSGNGPRPVDALADPNHLADTDPSWAGGDRLRIRRLAWAVTPELARPALGLVNAIPGPVAGAPRAGLDILVDLTPKGRPA